MQHFPSVELVSGELVSGDKGLEEELELAEEQEGVEEETVELRDVWEEAEAAERLDDGSIKDG